MSTTRTSPLLVLLSFLNLSIGSTFATEVQLSSATDVARYRGEGIGDQTGGEAASCDVNGDGLADLIIAADLGDGPNENRTYAGEVSVIFGRRGAWSGAFELAARKNVWITGAQAFDSAGAGLGCGDLNEDGYSEIFIGAPDSDSIADLRLNAGQVHIVWGRATWPALIDLLSDPGSVVYGARESDGAGKFTISSGDVTGDGHPELVVPAYQASNQIGTKPIVGKLHILFWRSSWPAVLDLQGQSDVTIYGRSASDGLGVSLVLGDLEADGTLDVIAGAPGGDGPLDSRPNTGHAYVFRGRTSWPSLINLAASNADSVIYGVDANDSTFNGKGLAVGNVDNDNRVEVLTGARKANGSTNTEPLTGEARSWQTIAALPPTVDLATRTRRVAYGAAANDYTARGTRAGDINGDGTDDWVIDAVLADGPAGIDAGAVYVFYGSPGLATDLRVSNGQQDVTIHGPNPQAESIVTGLSDVNADGILEVVVTSSLSSSTLPASVYLVSPIDSDGDGVPQLSDVCPLVYDPAQLDSDGDRLGDLCEGDYDADLVPDAQDCAPSQPQSGRPSEVREVLIDSGAPSRIEWSSLPTADRYDVTRGSAALLATGDYGACQNSRDATLTDTVFLEPEIPAPGASFVFLVRGVDLGCGGSGTYGTRSDGTARLNSNPLGCP